MTLRTEPNGVCAVNQREEGLISTGACQQSFVFLYMWGCGKTDAVKKFGGWCFFFLSLYIT